MSLIPDNFVLVPFDVVNQALSKYGDTSITTKRHYFISSNHDHISRIKYWIDQDNVLFDYIWRNIVSFFALPYLQIGDRSADAYIRDQFLRRAGQILVIFDQSSAHKNVTNLIKNEIDDALITVKKGGLNIKELSLEELENRNLKIEDDGDEALFKVDDQDYDQIPDLHPKEYIEPINKISHNILLLDDLGILTLLKNTLQDAKGGNLNDTEIAKVVAKIIGKPYVDNIRTTIRNLRNKPKTIRTAQAIKSIEKILSDLMIRKSPPE